MNADSFCYWLNGHIELGNGKLPSEKQWEIIKDHLNLVFNKVTPNRSLLNSFPSGVPVISC